ncbi:calcium/sodium antiporter [Halobium salinum]|uniref:Calcium/sodium antiporter n=1 Tax=Halobium salinum TaxID=1364940 RepID=A0ABD5P8U5_9EURY|nr:calcium/sodium antiporter [Halobium salinum]
MVDGTLAASVVFLLSVAALWLGAELFVTNAARIARRFGLSELVVGLTVVALGTSAPEVAVSVDAALVGTGDIAVANVVGSNLFNIGIVLGGIAAAVGVRSSRQMVRRDGAVMVGSTVLVLLFLLDLRLTRLEGAVLLLAFAGYLAWLFLRPVDGVESNGGTETVGVRAAVLLLTGLGVIVGGAHFLVESAVAIARAGGLSEWVIGETVVAVGTSTPEVVASVAAARKGMGDIAAGNLIGSNVFNALFILGIASTLTPLQVVDTAIGTTTWLLGLSVLAAVLLGTRGQLGRLEGAALVAINLTRWILDLL